MLIENDWLGSNPLFISKTDNKAASNILDLDLEGRKLSKEGLGIYFQFGYSAFQTTVFRDVEFSSPGEFITLDSTKSVIDRKISNRPFTNIQPDKTADIALETIEAWINNWENSFEGDIILPLSGGLDSRLLLSLIKNKKRVHTYTYGISAKSSSSHEVRIAAKLARSFNVKWKHIELDGYHRHLEKWNSLFGPSTHAHGMYQIEFYEQISKMHEPNSRVLSGIIGDAWAGSKKFEKVCSPSDVVNLALTHGLSDSQLERSAGFTTNNSKATFTAITSYFEENRSILEDERMRVVESMRIKMMLLRYLLLVPRHFGFVTESPFLDSHVAQTMLSIKSEQWNDRKWQKDYFDNRRLNPRWLIPPSTQNVLNLKAVINGEVPSLGVNKSEYVNLDWIDHNTFAKKHKLSIAFWYLVSRSNFISLVGSKLLKIFLKRQTKSDEILKLYNRFLLVYPLAPYI